MNEKLLLKIALIISLSGILILFFILESIEIKEYSINEINNNLIEKEIRVKGTIQKITETPGLYILDLKDETGEITVVIFKDETSLNLTVSQSLEISGKVQKYKDKLEIVTESISTTI